MNNPSMVIESMRSKSHWVVGIGVAVLSCLLFFDLLLQGLPNGSVYESAPATLFALSLASLVTLYPAVRNFALDRDLLEPTVILGGLLFLYFPVSAFNITILKADPTFPSFIASVDSTLAPLTWSLIVISLGTVAFYFGYWFAFEKRERTVWPKITRRQLQRPQLLAIWGFSVGIHLFRILGFVGSGNASFYFLTHWHYLGMLVLLAGYFDPDRDLVSTRSLVVVLLVELLLVTVLGFTLDLFLTLVVFVVLAYHYSGPGLTYRKLAALGGFIVVMFPISEIAESIQSGNRVEEAVLNGDLGLLWYVDAFAGRMIGTDALTMIIARTPEPIPFNGGQTLSYAVTGFVPRILWSGKPSIIMCGLNNKYFAGREVGGGTCAAMTVPGELFWNFGLAGVVGGMLCIGLLLGGVYRWFGQYESDPLQYVPFVIYAIVLLQLMRFEWGVAQVVQNLVKRIGFATVFLWLVTTPTSSKPVVLDGRSVLERSWTYQQLRCYSQKCSSIAGRSSIVSIGAVEWNRGVSTRFRSGLASSAFYAIVSDASSFGNEIESHSREWIARYKDRVRRVIVHSRTYGLLDGLT